MPDEIIWMINWFTSDQERCLKNSPAHDSVVFFLRLTKARQSNRGTIDYSSVFE
jgi:hypothetical protein